jgi:hypothetical protein
MLLQPDLELSDVEGGCGLRDGIHGSELNHPDTSCADSCRAAEAISPQKPSDRLEPRRARRARSRRRRPTAPAVGDTARTTTYVITFDGEEHRCATPEEVSKVVSQYQMEHPGDPDLGRISVARSSGGEAERLPAQQFLPQQIP